MKFKSKLLMLISLVLSLTAISAEATSSDEMKVISQLIDQGQQSAALDKLNAYVLSNPRDAQAIFTRGVLLAELNRRDDAIKEFTVLTEKFPNLPEPYNNLAVLYADAGQYDKAQKALEAAIKTHPSYATAHENLGDIYARRASEAYDKALQLDNSNNRAQSKLALIKNLFNVNNNPTTATAKPSVVATAKPVTNSKPTILPITPAKPVVKPDTSPSEPVNDSKNVVADSALPSDDADNQKQILNSVRAWANAWSAQNVDKYFESYSDTFKTPHGESRKDWEQMRRDRISKPSRIKVAVDNLKTVIDGNSAKVTFRQSYSAGNDTKNTNKKLMMQKINGAWLIDQEIAGN